MYTKHYRIALGLAAVFAVTGCATQKNLYYWGEYEPIIYDMYVNPGEADPQTQIEKLTRTIQRAQNSDLQVAPGLYAHLGMIYAQVGDVGMAKEAFSEEVKLYPEAKTFVDGILNRSSMEAN